MSRSPLYIVGDPHGHWTDINSKLVDVAPGVVVLVGDLGLRAPLRCTVSAALSYGHTLRWIPGNHDIENGANLLWGDAPDLCLHGRAEEVGGWSLAGLGGVFRGRVWWPKSDEEPRHRSGDALLRADRRLRHTAQHLETIFPDDVKRLSRQRADVLITHEAGTSHEHGFEVLDDLAADMRVAVHAHGHHHRSYSALSARGVAVRGLGIAEVWQVPNSGEVE